MPGTLGFTLQSIQRLAALGGGAAAHDLRGVSDFLLY